MMEKSIPRSIRRDLERAEKIHHKVENAKTAVERDITRVIWTRDYFKELIGRVPDRALIVLNGLVQESEAFFKNRIKYSAYQDLWGQIRNDQEHIAGLQPLLIATIHDRTMPDKVRLDNLEALSKTDLQESSKLIGEIVTDPKASAYLKKIAVSFVSCTDKESALQIFKLVVDLRDMVLLHQILSGIDEFFSPEAKSFLQYLMQKEPKLNRDCLQLTEKALRTYDGFRYEKIVNDTLKTNHERGAALLQLAKINGYSAEVYVRQFIQSPDAQLHQYAVRAALFTHASDIQDLLIGQLDQLRIDGKEIVDVLIKINQPEIPGKVAAVYDRLNDAAAIDLIKLFQSYGYVDAIPLMRARINETGESHHRVRSKLTEAIRELEKTQRSMKPGVQIDQPEKPIKSDSDIAQPEVQEEPDQKIAQPVADVLTDERIGTGMPARQDLKPSVFNPVQNAGTQSVPSLKNSVFAPSQDAVETIFNQNQTFRYVSESNRISAEIDANSKIFLYQKPKSVVQTVIVSIEPDDRRISLAQWQIINAAGVYRFSDEKETHITGTTYEIEFTDIPGWIKPKNIIGSSNSTEVRLKARYIENEEK